MENLSLKEQCLELYRQSNRRRFVTEKDKAILKNIENLLGVIQYQYNNLPEHIKQQPAADNDEVFWIWPLNTLRENFYKMKSGL